ncbi:2-(R)-hydroxypropyl-CoM dehydrogenase [Luteitalea pratensis]|uniref:2-(R)-hydroxypropyl-CoM dehydrogenase n=1 Tax=Luteitalea pratensis TaxID=1855912 RepID=A0A143PSV6_LUTPR|nr:SDR family oxidoreductase [Luteitalea pratensis]AMY11725.1 2-(R)-hydroxypropyl-CoM dehydrogenase [Luteitalea pratensis]
MTLQGVRALVTGANQGFGEAVARRYVQEGARVFLCARNAARLDESGRALQALAASPDMVQWMPADVSRPADVEAMVAAAVSAFGGLDVLVCNAGVYGPKGPIETVDWQEWSDAITINLGGAVLCCRAALPHMRAQGHGAIVLLSGGGATKPMPFLSAYAASKAALVRFGETLAEEVADAGITVNAVAPGALNTRLLDEVLDAGAERVGEAFYAQALKQKASGGTPLDRGAELCAFLASPAARGVSGRLISAVWDPWAELPQLAEQLRGSDIYTLRRIVPEDRGKQWGTPS